MVPFEQLILVDPREPLVAAWRDAFNGGVGVRFVCGRFEELPTFDCMVSAANSFGLMDGGVDLAISKFFGWELMDRVQDHILKEFAGEQPVGTSFLIATGNPKHPFLAHTPTMRVPMDIRGTDHVYLAMSAMIRAIVHFNRAHAQAPIRTVACPGLGTATGKVPPDVAARQMALAWAVACEPQPRINWEIAHNRQACVRGTWMD